MPADDARRPLDYGDYAVSASLDGGAEASMEAGGEQSTSVAVNVSVGVTVGADRPLDQPADVSSLSSVRIAASAVQASGVDQRSMAADTVSGRFVDVAVGPDLLFDVAMETDGRPQSVSCQTGGWTSSGRAEARQAISDPYPQWTQIRFTFHPTTHSLSDLLYSCVTCFC